MVAGVFVSDHCTCRTLEDEKNTRSCPFLSLGLVVRFHDPEILFFSSWVSTSGMFNVNQMHLILIETA